MRTSGNDHVLIEEEVWNGAGTGAGALFIHHGDNPLLRPTGIEIATKSYAALQAMAPTNIKMDSSIALPSDHSTLTA